MLHAVIMAGGSGTRFWPLSRREKPKQCLALGTAQPLIVETSHRIAPLVSIKNQMIVASETLKEQLTSLYPNDSMPQFLWEPCARNTAPCIGLAALLVHEEDPDGVMVVLPSDHHVDDEEQFREALITASNAAANGDIVTLGIVPTRAETGFGYIQTLETSAPVGHLLAVERFVEKPTLKVAEAYLAGGQHFWNSGMFVLSARRMLSDLERYQPAIYDGLCALKPFIGSLDFSEKLAEVFPRMPSISMDYGIMEPASADVSGGPIKVLPTDFGWNDVGSWNALSEYGEVDDQGNIVAGRVLTIDSHGSIIQAIGPAAAVIGLRDMVVVTTRDAVLVCSREDAQRVKEIPGLAKELGLDDLC